MSCDDLTIMFFCDIFIYDLQRQQSTRTRGGASRWISGCVVFFVLQIGDREHGEVKKRL